MFIPTFESLVSRDQPTSCLLSSIAKRDLVGTAECKHHHQPYETSDLFTDFF